ncbi:MAG: alpha/beta hydrolase [Deltaproteobacteria bacterium]|nr:alpha/beta hydrolase [Deltaproteobacteria bacterium]
MPPSFENREIISYDGVRIVYQVAGFGPPIVMANGLGGAFEVYDYQIRNLIKNHRLICWDYRGLFRSEKPDLSRMTIPDQVDDLNRILDAEGVNQALYLGWSMGSQVILEQALRRPDRVLGLIILCGAAGRPLDTALYTGLSKYYLPPLFELGKKVHKPIAYLMRTFGTMPGAFELLYGSGLFWRGGDEILRNLLHDYVQLDIEALAQTMIELGRHDARPYLRDVRVPVLQVAATADFFTPIPVAKKMQSDLPDAELHIVKGGTHYAPIEQPDLINDLINDFIERKITFPSKATPAQPKPKKAAAKKAPVKRAAKTAKSKAAKKAS